MARNESVRSATRIIRLSIQRRNCFHGHVLLRYLRQIDRFNDFSVSGYVTAGHVKLLLLHRTPPASTAATRALEDAIREFFGEVHEFYLKVSTVRHARASSILLIFQTLMNPFYEPNSLLSSPSFDEHVKSSAKKCLPSQ